MAKKTEVGKKKIIKSIDLPEGVEAHLSGRFLIVKGPKGEVKKGLKQHDISVKIDDRKIVLESKSSTKTDKKIIGSLAAHIKNMMKGSLQSHMYTLKICSGHFPMSVSVSNGKLIVKNILGEKVPRVLQLKNGAEVKVEGDLIHVTSPNKETAGQIAADIEQLTRRPGYDSRIFQDGLYIINKDGKEIK